MIKKIIYSLFIIIACSCSDDNNEISAKPKIEFVSITPSAVTEFKEEIVLVIKYTDGDGDLGENDPDVKNLFITDQRNDVEYTFRIPQLAPSDKAITIEGELAIDMNSLSVVGSGNSESAVFSIYVVDRSGKQSNTITSTAVTVSK